MAVNEAYNPDVDIESAKAYADARQQDLLSSVPKRLIDAEETIVRRIGRQKGGPFAQLESIYALSDAISAELSRGAPCGRGCSGCCHYNVSIYQLEAAYIQKKASISLPSTLPLRRDFHGTACPFLKGGACSIYRYRPYVCRANIAFTRTAYWCAPERANEYHLPMVRLSGLEQAMALVATSTDMGECKDIREFFGFPAPGLNQREDSDTGAQREPQ